MSQTPDPLPAPAGTADERTILEGFLEQYRAILMRKTSGLTDDQARKRLVASGTTVAGLVRHLGWVEEAWFAETLDGGPRPAWRDEAPEQQFEPGDEPIDQLLADYLAACERSREVAARHALDDTGAHPRLGTVSLRWIYAHMIEELARHAGHIDILREQIDQTVGFD